MTKEERFRETVELCEAFKRQANEVARRLDVSGAPTQEVMAVVLAAMSEYAGRLIYGVSTMVTERDEFIRESVKLLSGQADLVISDLMAAERAARQ